MTLREKLQHMTEAYPAERHSEQLQEISVLMPNSIKIIDSPYPIGGYTCVVHSFELTQDPTYLSIAESGLGRTFAGTDFIHYLLSQKMLTEVQSNDVAAGDLVFYFDNQVFKHVGSLLDDGGVNSKWGLGYLYEHPLWEVPSGYGGTVKFYRKLQPGEGLDLFIEFAKSRGFQSS